MIILVLYIMFTIGLAHAENGKPPLCVLCECIPLTADNSDYEIICLNKLHVNFYDISFWKNVTSNIPYKFSSLTINNNVFENLSMEFPTSELIHLNFAKNAISSVSVSIFKNLTILETLILSSNQIEMFKPGTSKENTISLPLTYLKEIRLDHNKISSLNADFFKYTTIMSILDLSNNPMDNIDEQTHLAISSLENLKELYLHNTGIKTLPSNIVHNPNSLQILDISGNPFELIPEGLSQVQSLTNLYMNNTGIKQLNDHNKFPNIPTLKTLHFCHNEKLVLIERFSFGGLENIEDLKLSNNLDLSRIEPYALARTADNREGLDWIKLKKFHLQYNNISYLDKNISGAWDSLEDLDIGGNPWICDCKNYWVIYELYPKYLNINEVQANSLRCAAPEKRAGISFRELYENKSLKCPEEPDERTIHDPSSPLVPSVIGFFSGFLVAIPLIIFLMLGYQRNWHYHLKVAVTEDLGTIPMVSN